MSVRNAPDSQTTLRGKQVLVVEDEAIIAMLLEDELLALAHTLLEPTLFGGAAIPFSR